MIMMKCSLCFTFLLRITVTVAFYFLPVFDGDTVQLFPCTAIGSRDNTVLIYINGNKNILIARWTLKNCTIKLESVIQNFKEKLFMDTCRNIWIRNVSSSDEGTYTLFLGIEEGAPKFDVNLSVSGKKVKEEQIQRWLEDHPGFTDKYIGEKVTEEQIKKWLEDHPNFSKKSHDYWIAVYVIMALILQYIIFKIGWFLQKEYVRMKQQTRQKMIPYMFQRLGHLMARQECGHQTDNDLDPVIMNHTVTSGETNLIPDENENEDSTAMLSIETCPLLEEDDNEDSVFVNGTGETESLIEGVGELQFINLDIDRRRSEAITKLKRYGMTLPPRKRKFTV